MKKGVIVLYGYLATAILSTRSPSYVGSAMNVHSTASRNQAKRRLAGAEVLRTDLNAALRDLISRQLGPGRCRPIQIPNVRTKQANYGN